MSSEGQQTHHWVVNLGIFPQKYDLFNQVNINTMIMVWLGMALLLGIAFVMSRSLKKYPTSFQTFGEMMFDLCRSITMSTAGKRGDTFLFYIGSLFLFLLTVNLMGQLPLRLIHVPQGELMAATGDFNTPAALAIMTVVMYFAFGIGKKGLSYFKHYLGPIPNPLAWAFFVPMSILEDVTRPFSLMIRLYANILVGEILSGLALAAMPLVAPCFVILLELFVACLQAYIFAILSSVYITLLTAEEH